MVESLLFFALYSNFLQMASCLWILFLYCKYCFLFLVVNLLLKWSLFWLRDKSNKVAGCKEKVSLSYMYQMMLSVSTYSLYTFHHDCYSLFCYGIIIFSWLSSSNFVIFFMVQVGNEERIHVYYAHGEDSPTFVRRCYWLLDKYVIITVYLEPLMTLLFYTCIS